MDYKKDINQYLTNEQKQEFIQDLLSIVQVGGKFDELASKYGVDAETIAAWKDEVLSESAPQEKAERPKTENVLDKLIKHDRQGSFDQIKKPVKTAIGVAIAVVIGIIGLRIGLAIYNRPTTFDPFQYVSVEYNGLDGFGTAEASFDYKAASTDLGVKVDKDDLKPVVGTKNHLSNGDTLKVSLNESSDLIQKKLSPNPTSKNYKVKGLELGDQLDVFKGVTVVFSGTEGNGTAEVKVAENKDFTDDEQAYIRKIDYELSKDSRLSEGDIVTVTAKVPESVIEEYQIVPEKETKKFTVTKLGKVATDIKDFNKDALKKYTDTQIPSVKQKVLAHNSESLQYAFGAGTHWWTVDQNRVVKNITSIKSSEAFLISNIQGPVIPPSNRGTESNTDPVGDITSNRLVLVYTLSGYCEMPKDDKDEGWHDDWGPGCVYLVFNHVSVNADGSIDTKGLSPDIDNVTDDWDGTTVPRTTENVQQNIIQPYINEGYKVTNVNF